MTAPSAPAATAGTDVHSQAEDEPAECAECLEMVATDFVFGRTGPATTGRDGGADVIGTDVANGDWERTGVEVAAGTVTGFLTTARIGAAAASTGASAVTRSASTPRERRSTERLRAKQWR
jgi:hypothetical protein